MKITPHRPIISEILIKTKTISLLSTVSYKIVAGVRLGGGVYDFTLHGSILLYTAVSCGTMDLRTEIFERSEGSVYFIECVFPAETVGIDR